MAIFNRTQQAKVARHFDSLVRPHVDHLYRVAWRLTGSTDDAEDLVQDVLIKMFDQFDKLASLDNPRTWMARVLRNRFIDIKRRAQRWESLEEPDGFTADEAHLSSAPADPESEAIRASDGRRIEAAMSKLDQDHRLLMVLHVVEGYTLEELTEVFDLPLGTLKSRLHRARRQLKKSLDVEPFSGPARVSQ